MAGATHRDAGSILVSVWEIREPGRACSGSLPWCRRHVPRFYAELTVWEHLQFIALAHRAEAGFAQRAEVLLQEFGLWEARQLYPHALSRGMRLKLGLLLALIRPFHVLLLDEPQSALDTRSTDILRQKLAELRAQGAAILLTTHAPELVRGLAHRTWTIRRGILTCD